MVSDVCATAPNDNPLFSEPSNEYTITRPAGTGTALKLTVADVADTRDITNEAGAAGATLAVVADIH